MSSILDVIASSSTYPCQSVGQSVRESFIVSDLEIAIASPSFASLFLVVVFMVVAFPLVFMLVAFPLLLDKFCW